MATKRHDWKSTRKRGGRRCNRCGLEVFYRLEKAKRPWLAGRPSGYVDRMYVADTPGVAAKLAEAVGPCTGAPRR